MKARILPACSNSVGDEELLALCDMRVAHQLSPENQEITRTYAALSLAIEEHRKKEKEIYKKSIKKMSNNSSSSSSSSSNNAQAEDSEMKRRGDDGIESVGRIRTPKVKKLRSDGTSTSTSNTGCIKKSAGSKLLGNMKGGAGTGKITGGVVSFVVRDDETTRSESILLPDAKTIVTVSQTVKTSSTNVPMNGSSPSAGIQSRSRSQSLVCHTKANPMVSPKMSQSSSAADQSQRNVGAEGDGLNQGRVEGVGVGTGTVTGTGTGTGTVTGVINRNDKPTAASAQASLKSALLTIEEAIRRIKEVEDRAEELLKEGSHAESSILSERARTARLHIDSMRVQQAKAERIRKEYFGDDELTENDSGNERREDGSDPKELRLRGNLFTVDFLNPSPTIVEDARAQGLDLTDKRARRIMHELQKEAGLSQERSLRWKETGYPIDNPDGNDDFVARVIDRVYREESRELAGKLIDGLSRGVLLGECIFSVVNYILSKIIFCRKLFLSKISCTYCIFCTRLLSFVFEFLFTIILID